MDSHMFKLFYLSVLNYEKTCDFFVNFNDNHYKKKNRKSGKLRMIFEYMTSSSEIPRKSPHISKVVHHSQPLFIVGLFQTGQTHSIIESINDSYAYLQKQSL